MGLQEGLRTTSMQISLGKSFRRAQKRHSITRLFNWLKKTTYSGTRTYVLGHNTDYELRIKVCTANFGNKSIQHRLCLSDYRVKGSKDVTKMMRRKNCSRSTIYIFC